MGKSKVISKETQKKIQRNMQKKTMEGQKYMKEMVIARDKHTYIMELVSGRYYAERCNMIAEQVTNNKIVENVDGCPKPLSMMRAEYALMKVRAINAMRNAYFAKKDLKKAGLTDEDISKLEDSYYNGKIIRSDADYEEDPGKPRGKAGFQPS